MAMSANLGHSNGTSPSEPPFRVFISHAGEDKATIAIPLRDKLRQLGITSFVDEYDLPLGSDAVEGMTQAMETAEIGLVILSPEFVAKKWPMKELMCFLRRRRDADAEGTRKPALIPVFYRLAISDLYDEPRLDRLQNGASLYQTTRFFERRDRGEPEANIAQIRESLRQVHRLMGIRNDVDASNDSSMLMATRRDILLQNISISVTAVIEHIDAPLRASLAAHSAPSRTFRAHYDQAIGTEYLVLDFHSRGSDNRPKTVEGKLFNALMDVSAGQNTTIGIEGPMGVGKTCLLQGLLGSRELRERFKGGIFFSGLGRTATFGHMRDVLSALVEKAGDEAEAEKIRSKTDWGQVIQAVRSFFDKKQCLFMFDDVWEEGFVTADIVRSLISLQRPLRSDNDEQNNKVILTTRSIDVASTAGISLSLEPVDVLGRRARDMLYEYSGIRPNESNPQEMIAIEAILQKCGGLPQSIAVEGRVVRNLSNTQQGQGALAYHLHAYSLRS